MQETGLIPGSGISPQDGNSNLLQYSCLENSINRGAWWATVHGIPVRCDWTHVHEYTHTHTLGEANKQGYRIYQAFHIWKGLYCKNADLLEFHIRQHFKKKQQTNICGHLDIGEFFTVPSFLWFSSLPPPLSFLCSSTFKLLFRSYAAHFKHTKRIIQVLLFDPNQLKSYFS